MKFTQRKIETLECSVWAKDALVFDDEQRGLAIRITASGNKSFLAQYTSGRRNRRIPLGSCSLISLAAALTAVQEILGKVATDRDPALNGR